MTSTPRRTLRIPDDEWDAGHEKARANGENLTAVLRRLLSEYLADDTRVEYRATSRATIGGEPHVVSGLTGDLDEIRQVYPPSRWTLEQYNVSPPQLVKRQP